MDKDARLFYRVAQQRLVEAEDLMRLGYTTVAVYLGGYVVETMLKVLLIERSPRVRRKNIVREFRGGKGHDLEHLRSEYYDSGGPAMPIDVAQSFAQIVSWSTDLRYYPGMVRLQKAQSFLRAVNTLFKWAKGRI